MRLNLNYPSSKASKFEHKKNSRMPLKKKTFAQGNLLCYRCFREFDLTQNKNVKLENIGRIGHWILKNQNHCRYSRREEK